MAGVIVFVLIGMGVWALVITVGERLYSHAQARRQSRLYAARLDDLLKQGRLTEAMKLSGSREFRHSHLAKVVLAGLQEFQFQQESGEKSREVILEAVKRSIQHAITLTATDLHRGISTLLTIASVAPFVALLGTVVGVTGAFRMISATDSVGIRELSEAISNTLLVVAIGLTIAMVVGWAYSYLTYRVDHFNVEMDSSEKDFMTFAVEPRTA